VPEQAIHNAAGGDRCEPSRTFDLKSGYSTRLHPAVPPRFPQQAPFCHIDFAAVCWQQDSTQHDAVGLKSLASTPLTIDNRRTFGKSAREPFRRVWIVFFVRKSLYVCVSRFVMNNPKIQRLHTTHRETHYSVCGSESCPTLVMGAVKANRQPCVLFVKSKEKRVGQICKCSGRQNGPQQSVTIDQLSDWDRLAAHSGVSQRNFSASVSPSRESIPCRAPAS
jgi:hypothetical protein